ncbi:FtsK/SpoIIIE domain-containing protein [Microbacterium gorillae]|uniref:FtsK/SpoIIIE domain-containing protein n=1 Tax=Microbacterium gorillae TaxID=1231063 RepID=UPI00058ABDFB|nr:FtsK/SpoIIIE domain-containing protein [Microbacterium gorillae]
MSAEPFGATFRDDLGRLLGAADAAHAATEHGAGEALQSANDTHTAAIRGLDEYFGRKRSTGQDDIEDRVRSAQRTLDDTAAQIPGALGSLDPEIVHAPLPVPSDGLVVGSVDGVPVPVPLASHAGLVLRGDADAANAFVEAVFARILATVPLSSLRVSVFDPSLRGLLGAFSELRNHTLGAAFPAAYTDEYRFRQRLEDITADVQRGAEQLSARGRGSVLDIWQDATPTPSLHVVVIDDVPGTINEETWRGIDRITVRGPACGVIVVLLQSARASGAALSPSGRASVIAFSSAGSATLGEGDAQLLLQPLERPNHDALQRLLREVIAGASEARGPVVGPEALLPPDGTASSADGVEVVIGERSDGKPLTIAFRSQNPPIPNALIGGATGRGKSNLLAVLIYAIAAKYPPSEIEMLLLDFKEGLEFRRFAGEDGASRLPNARTIALESDREFGVATLEHLERTRQERSALFKSAGVNDYDSYRAQGQELPRLMLFIDEFDVMLKGDDELAARAVSLLEMIVRRGRAAGIHLVLATQTLSGIRSLATKLDAILSQIPLRIGLQNTAAEAQTIFAPGNKAPSELQFRGQVVINDAMGEDPGKNVFGMSTFADVSFTVRLQERLAQDHPQHETQRTFVGTQPEPWPDDLPPGRHVALGAAVDTVGRPVLHEFGADPMRSLAIVGTDQEVRSELTRATVYSAVTGGEYRTVVVIGDSPLLSWAARLTDGPVDVITVSLADAAEWIATHPDQLRAAQTLTVVSDLQRIGGLSEPRGEADPNDFLSQPPTAAGTLRDAVVDPRSAGDVVLTSANFTPIDRAIGMSRDGADGIAAYALASVPTADLRQLIGFEAEAPRSSPRFLYVRAGYPGAQTAVPFDAPAEGRTA